MKCTGTITELEIDLDECDFDVIDAVAESDHISVDWIEDDETFHAKLRSTDDVTYTGNYGCPQPSPDWSMTATRYDSADGTILLLAKWFQDDIGLGGACIFELMPEIQGKLSQREK